ncbi:hypothetical protein QFC24_001025 [Naganishia onofrii]|uniref:Uncharacterized protein n=1 Tax=Naganishia onofrii TaxID=1851511 RepID=A0ACC2XUB4_9TREE|nr:hypothetical protein QFC24_001025 [Naganishia onofrii]
MVQTLPPRNGESSLPKPTPWQPKRYLEPTQPPPDERIKKEQYEAALAASELWGGGVDFAGRPPKLLKPRRTVDYLSGVGRYMTAHDHPIYALSYTHSGQFFLSADNSGSLKYFTPQINNLTTLQAHREACRAISFSPTDEKFATGGDDGHVKIWTFGEAREEKVCTGHGWDVRDLEWHPFKGLVVSGSKDLLVKFWDPRLGKDISTFPDGNLVATAGGEGLIRLFDIRTFKELEPLKGHKEPITALAWHPVHNTLLTSGSYDGSIFHWNLDSAEPTVPVSMVQEAHDQVVWSFDYHPLGHVLASTSRDCSVRFWARARPQGGQEVDRWHVGDAMSQTLGGVKWQQRAEEEEQGELRLPFRTCIPCA